VLLHASAYAGKDVTLTEGFVLCSKTLPQSSVLTGFSEDHIFVGQWC
jgi:hypothetical protein